MSLLLMLAAIAGGDAVLLGSPNNIAEDDPTSVGTVGFIVDNDGDIWTRQDSGSGYVSNTTWIGNAAASAYEIRVTGTGDAPTYTGSGTGDGTNQWLSCSTDHKYEWSASIIPESFSGTIEWRVAGTGLILGSVTVTMSCL
jgi:hypothetical protein